MDIDYHDRAVPIDAILLMMDAARTWAMDAGVEAEGNVPSSHQGN
jgi:hypothetical protein